MNILVELEAMVVRLRLVRDFGYRKIIVEIDHIQAFTIVSHNASDSLPNFQVILFEL